MNSSDRITVDGTWLYLRCGGETYFGGEVEEDELPSSEASPAGTRELAEGEALAESVGGTMPPPPEEEGEEPYDSSGAVTLNPCYELFVLQTPKGMTTNAIPFGVFSERCPVTLVPEVVVRVADMGESDRAELVRLVKNAEETRLAARAARSGVSLVR
jgi:hypothetical protein